MRQNWSREKHTAKKRQLQDSASSHAAGVETSAPTPAREPETPLKQAKQPPAKKTCVAIHSGAHSKNLDGKEGVAKGEGPEKEEEEEEENQDEEPEEEEEENQDDCPEEDEEEEEAARTSKANSRGKRKM